MDYEKLGVFYLGKNVDLKDQRTLDELTLYDSKDLVTHALAVGMTGSGKTGLCVGIIEEAAIDGVPSIVIDPKGDLTNLLLTFPNMTADDFLPWVNNEEARKKGMSTVEYAAKQAQTWKEGLASWGQDLERVRRFKEAADFVIYTPGSTAGIPVSILKTLSTPAKAITSDEELFQEKISTTVSSLLTLLKLPSDPLTSREHILLSNILDQLWREGKDLDVPILIGAIQNPPVKKIGVLDLDTFYPQKERLALAMMFNNLIASPSFGTWLNGEALDINKMLFTEKGKPRVSIFSIAHLSDPERMFFVTLLLDQVLAWARSQSGTTSLRALLYMDEIYGYFPPVENPPSKKPLISLLKQARAFGLGLVLSTQNPVDLDYKGLSNIGTWFIGRLQTERDKMKMIEGLESASQSSSFNRALFDRLISDLGKRVFLMNNVHEDEPVLFQTRWVLSYLAGPLTRDQIKQLMGERGQQVKEAIASANPPKRRESVEGEKIENAPIIPATIQQLYYDREAARGDVVYRPLLIGNASVKFAHTKSRLICSKEYWLTLDVDPDSIRLDWTDAEEKDFDQRNFGKKPLDGAKFLEPNSEIVKEKNYKIWNTSLIDHLYQTATQTIYYDPVSKEYSNEDETEQDFRARNRQLRREERDEAVKAMREKYAAKIRSSQEKVRKAQLAVDREKEQANQSKMQTAVSFGTTLLGAFTGKLISSSNISRAGTALKGVTRSMQQSGDIDRAEDTLETYKASLQDLEMELESEIANMEDLSAEFEIEEIMIRPKKSDIAVHVLGILWVAE